MMGQKGHPLYSGVQLRQKDEILLTKAKSYHSIKENSEFSFTW